jgi:hypothetical protein
VVGVEVSGLDQGAPLTPVVASAVPTAALAVLDVLAAAPADAGPPRGAGPRA